MYLKTSNLVAQYTTLMASIQLLIVEDNFFVAEEIQASIETLGFSVSARVDNGKDAIQEVMNNKPDLAVMDIRIKGEMDGIETAAQLGRDYGIPIIYMTDQSDKETYEKAKATAPHAFLQKPVTPVTLQRSIELAIVQVYKEQKEQEKEQTLEGGTVLNKHYMLKNEKELHAIELESIIRIKASGAYCELKTDQKKWTIARPMAAVIKSLNRSDYCKENLIKISRSVAVNLSKVSKISGNKVAVGEESFPFGETYRKLLFEKIQLV